MSFLFGCSHENTTFPITLKNAGRLKTSARTYIVCLECGREFPYSWEEMKVVTPVQLEADALSPQLDCSSRVRSDVRA